MKTKTKPAVKFDLSGIDPDHVAWLQGKAKANKMTVDELLMAERDGRNNLFPNYDQMTRGQRMKKEVEESVTVTVETTNAAPTRGKKYGRT
jgi:hypothetical protein